MAMATYKYVDDYGVEWAIYEMAPSAGDATKRGLAAADGTEIPFSASSHRLQLRKAAVIASNGKTYWLTCGTSSCAAYATLGTTLDSIYARRSGTAMNGRCYGHHGERTITGRGTPPA